MTKSELEREVKRLRSENRKLMQIIDRAMEQMADSAKREAERRWPIGLPVGPYEPAQPSIPKWPAYPYEITCSDHGGDGYVVATDQSEIVRSERWNS